mmetsp:Transcript_27421/g.75408  ORF Transcript_27421/g.75408 Transcript_27421/m.75408 type:complete len:129 (-) Transcript_27421:33-419(-)
MKPDWDKLMAEFKDSTTVLIADVDCTDEGQSKCKEVGVQGYPALKYGDPGNLQDYKGGRSLVDLRMFAEGLGLGAEEREARSDAERDALLASSYQAFVNNLNRQYDPMSAGGMEEARLKLMEKLKIEL